ncbi:MAG: LAGLIDADG homing endonuclease [Candidatus Yanofskybacteria bacterium GW2011_GWA1_44_21]|uniref:LAGLIDADG homing endonuclease n=1 Tax=Candidatus Yanofskybacteria bacterium GW2011_GWB1_45_11 TaxID=1619026 RepID=A0A0G1L3C5_9BACT|nr:MAG: LAGLIDADG homing endonuclease [Candidatus Yanofskybacteria bacterium GW2011_GWA1_44_21]KKT90240.1 MAG: LAGLIDADG homing endonuclease [Candidatus Yanofskybacteria bacterium GW2011_GWB1_45_11]
MSVLNLNKTQLAVIYGSIMGDAYLQSNGTNARLRFEHSLNQEQYVVWKFNFLKNIFSDSAIVKINRIHPKTKQEYKYVRCQSKTLPELKKIKVIFYPAGKKIVPLSIKKYLIEPISLAVWFMDDGYYYLRDKCGYLYLGNITKEEAEVCSDTLQNNFNLKTKVLAKKKGYALYFSRLEMLKLKKVVSEFMIPMFRYKLPH